MVCILFITKDCVPADPGRRYRQTRPSETTFFRSVGIAVQYTATMAVAFRNVEPLEPGQRVAW